MGYNEGVTGLANYLIPLGVTSDTLIEIQIKEIDADFARFNGDSGMKGNLGLVVNENLIPTKIGLAHFNSLITCKSAEVFTMGISLGNPSSSSQMMKVDESSSKLKVEAVHQPHQSP